MLDESVLELLDGEWAGENARHEGERIEALHSAWINFPPGRGG